LNVNMVNTERTTRTGRTVQHLHRDLGAANTPARKAREPEAAAVNINHS
jgi:hypothetical protein